jgi:hypothetical protein
MFCLAMVISCAGFDLSTYMPAALIEKRIEVIDFTNVIF